MVKLDQVNICSTSKPTSKSRNVKGIRGCEPRRLLSLRITLRHSVLAWTPTAGRMDCRPCWPESGVQLKSLEENTTLTKQQGNVTMETNFNGSNAALWHNVRARVCVHPCTLAEGNKGLSSGVYVSVGLAGRLRQIPLMYQWPTKGAYVPEGRAHSRPPLEAHSPLPTTSILSLAVMDHEKKKKN